MPKSRAVGEKNNISNGPSLLSLEREGSKILTGSIFLSSELASLTLPNALSVILWEVKLSNPPTILTFPNFYLLNALTGVRQSSCWEGLGILGSSRAELSPLRLSWWDFEISQNDETDQVKNLGWASWNPDSLCSLSPTWWSSGSQPHTDSSSPMSWGVLCILYFYSVYH